VGSRKKEKDKVKKAQDPTKRRVRDAAIIVEGQAGHANHNTEEKREKFSERGGEKINLKALTLPIKDIWTVTYARRKEKKNKGNGGGPTKRRTRGRGEALLKSRIERRRS